MKKWVSILFLTLFLFSATDLYEVVKVPVLIGHFMEHQKRNSELTFSAFLKTHYQNPVRDADHKTDKKLPFVVHSAPHSLVFTVERVFTFEIKNEGHRKIRSQKISSALESFCQQGFINSTFQPPRS